MQCLICGHDNAAGKANCAACGAPLNASESSSLSSGVALPPGTKLHNGAYTVGKILGQGGFGLTYKGADMSLRRFVAIKEFFPTGSSRHGTAIVPSHATTADAFSQSKSNFVREAGVLARFNHRGIVRVFSVFEENNTAYMVMEFLEGQTLGQRLLEKGALPEAEAVAILHQIGPALKTVHAAGLLHRDLKPDNIFLAADGRSVLIDFGTAREYTPGETRAMTREVTPGYAPLEQYGKQARFGPCTDVYALGATLYHCLTGDAPPPSLDRAVGVEVRPPDQVNPHLSRTVSRAILWALELQAPQRPQTVQELLDAVEEKIPIPRQSAGQVPLRTTVLPPSSHTQSPANAPPANSKRPPAPTSAAPTSVAPASVDISDIQDLPSKGAWGSGVSTADTSSTTLWVAVFILFVTLGAMFMLTRKGLDSIHPDEMDSDAPPATVNIGPENTGSASSATRPTSRRAYPPPMRTQTTVMQSSDAYAAACEIVSKRLKRPETAEFLPQSNTNCTVWARGGNQWQIESAGTALDNDGDRFYFAWSADIDYNPATGMWNCTSEFTDIEYDRGTYTPSDSSSDSYGSSSDY